MPSEKFGPMNWSGNIERVIGVSLLSVGSLKIGKQSRFG
jgi:hypothetical protein